MKKLLIFLLFVLGLSLFSFPAQALDVTAASGSAKDIQAAVDKVVAAGGGNVYIPEGTWDFVEVGESWMTVEIPVGVNLFGAPTERDVNDQVVNWKTILVMPFEAPDNSKFFEYMIDDDHPERTFRFSDIKLIGYRYYDINSTRMYYGITINGPYYGWTSPAVGVLDFRVDHCHFQDMGGSAFSIQAHAEICRRAYRGVIDHNRFINTWGIPAPYDSPPRTLGYGIMLRRWACDIWDPDITNIVGQYTNYTVFFEDNYFSKWRHGVCSNDGFHYVFRHNIIEGDGGYGSIDGHGSYADANYPWAVGTRGIEVYNNIFKDPDTSWATSNWDRRAFVINHRGGFGIFTNNTLIGYDSLCDLNNDWGNYEPYCPQCRINNTYIWGNNLGEARIIRYNSDSTENVHYFLRAPNLAQNGFEYEPYPYPHPLTLSELPSPEQVSISGKLVNKLNQPLQANVIIYNLGTNQIKTSDTTSNGNYDLSVSPNTYDLQYNILNFFIGNFFIKLISLDISSSLSNIINYITNINNQNVSFTVDITDTQLIQTYSPQKPQKVLINGTTISSVFSYSELTDNTWFYDSTEKRLYLITSPSLPAEYCGDGVCQATEDCSSCSIDCGTCPSVCGDGTPYDQCSSTKPLYCDNGNLINYCTQCECPSGQTCNLTTETCYSTGYIFEDGFESGYITEAEGGVWTGIWTSSGESVTAITTDPYRGAYHLNAMSDGSSIGERSAVYKNIAAQNTLYMRAYVKFKQVPDSSEKQAAFFWFFNIASGRALAQGHLDYSGGTAKWGINYNDGASWTSFTSTTIANANTWYYVELYWKKGSMNGVCKLYVNGTEIISITEKDTGDFGDVDRVYVGDLWDNFIVENYVDNVVVDETYIGP